MKQYKIIALLLVIAFIALSCSEKKCSGATKKAIAIVQSTAGNNVNGIVNFEQRGKQVKIFATVQGLSPNQKHGFHIHQYGDISAADGSKAGGHYNPGGVAHSLPHSPGERHLGDLGNLSADDLGVATLNLTLDNICLCCAEKSIIGRSVIVHQNEDDGGQPTGNAGPRIGMGIIGIAK